MRPPMNGDQVDTAETCRMVDAFLEAGFYYLDTAHGYLQGKSETALKTCLTSRHPRESYILTNKLTANFFQTEADIRPFFASQLDGLHGGSPASYALRFAAGFPGIMMVLSGMSDMAQMQDNISFMKDFRPLDEWELAAVEQVQQIFHPSDDGKAQTGALDLIDTAVSDPVKGFVHVLLKLR